MDNAIIHLFKTLNKIHRDTMSFKQYLPRISKMYERLNEIEDRLTDYFISWDETKRLLEEKEDIILQLKSMGWDENMNFVN